MTEPAERLRRMVDDLVAKGDLPLEWREAFGSVPRHVFIPDSVWRVDEDTEDVNDLVPLHRATDPDTWLELAYADDAVITQVDDGQPVGPGLIGHDITSSASMPTIVAIMLAALGVEPGMSVCEIGTGTGYNAALLATRLGAANVSTIEIDPQIASRARTALADTGHAQVTVVTGDGAQGHPPRAPYDRFLSTAAVQDVPFPWVAQTRPGGRIVTPWGTTYYNGGLLSLTVADDGTAQGNIVDKASFMWMRDQRTRRGHVSRDVYDEDHAAVTSTELHPYRVAGHYDVCIAIGIQVPQCRYLYQPAEDDSDEAILWLLDPWSRSWASLHHDPDVASDAYTIRQLGPRRLWDEVEAAYRWWYDAGSPAADAWQFTVTSQGQHVELNPP